MRLTPHLTKLRYSLRMDMPDLNLLVTLDVLLAEGNVTRAAQRLQLSPSAMSRSLARLREITGDPLLVRAGRGLVPTPRALELRSKVSQLVQDAQVLLRPEKLLELQKLERTFTLRTSEGFAENFGSNLIARINAEAPHALLRLPNFARGPSTWKQGSSWQRWVQKFLLRHCSETVLSALCGWVIRSVMELSLPLNLQPVDTLISHDAA
jgi:Bacterial regulatory helix-turn-helix protein, lysR family